MLKRTIVGVAIVLCAGAITAAQAPKPVPAKPAPAREVPVQRPPEPAGQPINIKIEVTITDQSAPGEAAKKIISMIVGDRQNNSIRTNASVPVRIGMTQDPAIPGPFSYREVRINVDAHPILLKDNKISLNFGLEYIPQPPNAKEKMSEAALAGTASLNERLGLILESGKPVVVSQAADPTSDRRITVEVVATILK